MTVGILYAEIAAVENGLNGIKFHHANTCKSAQLMACQTLVKYIPSHMGPWGGADLRFL